MIALDLPPESVLPGTFLALLRDERGNSTHRTLPRGRAAVAPAETLHFDDDPQRPPLTDEAVASIAGLPHLGFVTLRGASLTPAGVAHLAALPALKSLVLRQAPVTGELIASLAGSATLLSIELRDCAAGDDALDVAARAPALQSLHLSPPAGSALAITDAGLARLGAAPSLVSLSLEGATVTGEGFAAWAGARALRGVGLRRCGALTDAGLAGLAPLAELTSVRVPHCARVTDAACDTLAKLPALEWVDLAGCGKVTDAGLMKLAGLRALKLLYVGSSKSARKVTTKGIAAFEQAHGSARCLRH